MLLNILTLIYSRSINCNATAVYLYRPKIEHCSYTRMFKVRCGMHALRLAGGVTINSHFEKLNYEALDKYI